MLFQTSEKAYIEGTIVGEAIQPMVGGTTLIQETSSSSCLLICFYNVLPDGIRGADAEELLEDEFPLGATLRIAEPFYKIFADGQRGIRVDTPSDLHVITKNSTNQKRQLLSEKNAKESGNEFVRKKQYLAAIDMYLKGLLRNPNSSCSEADFVATVLSNRSQAYIQLENWTLGLCDAAASLTIRPNFNKTLARYQKCIIQLMPE